MPKEKPTEAEVKRQAEFKRWMERRRGTSERTLSRKPQFSGRVYQNEWAALSELVGVRQRSLTVAEVARRMGKTRQAVSRFELSLQLRSDDAAFRAPSIAMLRGYTEALGLRLGIAIALPSGEWVDLFRYVVAVENK